MSQIENAIIVSPLDEKMEQELVKHNVTDAVIATLKSKYGDLKLRTLDDKETYLVIKTAAKEVAKVRTTVTKLCKEGRDEALKIQKKWIAKEKEVLAKVAEVETPLDDQVEAFDNHAKELELAEKRRQEEQYMSRTQALTKIGALYHDASFTLGEFTLDANFVKESSQSVWDDEILPRFMEEHLKIEAERVEQEKKEAERKEAMRKEQIELQRQQAELLKQMEEFQQQKREAERKEQEERQKLQNERFGRIILYDRAGEGINMAALWTLSEEQFEQILTDKKAAYDHQQQMRMYKIEEAAAQKERERIAEEQRQEAIRKQQEALKKQEELSKAMDKEKWADVVTYLQNTPVHEMRSSQYRTKMKIVKDFLSDILKPV